MVAAYWAPEYLIFGTISVAAASFLFTILGGIRHAARAKPRLPEAPRVDCLVRKCQSSLRCTAISQAVFRAGRRIRLLQVALPGASANIELYTGYLDEWGQVQEAVAADISMVSEGPEIAAEALSAALSDLMSILSLSANAWVGEPDFKPSVQSNASGEMRELDEQATGSLFETIGSYPDTGELRQAIRCYREALAWWNSDSRARALMQLHRGLTAMSELRVRTRLRNPGLSRAELAREFAAPQEDLVAQVMRTELYRDDAQCLEAVEAIRRTAEPEDAAFVYYVVDDETLTRAAGYLRQAILVTLAADEAWMPTLLSAPYDEPLGRELHSPVEPTLTEEPQLVAARLRGMGLHLPGVNTGDPARQLPDPT
jgi:hypothetical protein